MRVLVVDDSSVMRKVIERTLRHSGLEIEALEEAANGQLALDRICASAHHFDLVLCDLNMPVMNGLQFAEALQAAELAARPPVLMITTESTEATVLRARAAGIRGYICKPFTAEQVKSRVLALLGTPAAMRS